MKVSAASRFMVLSLSLSFALTAIQVRVESPGNDDLGATSGVYVWNALGLYPAVPGVGGVAWGTPMFRHATVHLSDRRTLSIRGEGTGPYVQRVLLNGTEYPGSWLPLTALRAGTTELVFVLSTQPSRTRGNAAGARPPDFMK